MYSLYLASKLDREEEAQKAARAREEAILGPKHKTKRDRLAEHYHSRVEEWVTTQLEHAPTESPRERASAPVPELMFRARDKERELAGAVISPRTYQTEKERLAPIIARSESRQQRPLWPPYEAYKQVNQTEAQLRVRQPSKEIAPPFRHASGLQSHRVNDVITFRDIGGRSVPWEQPPQYPSFREKDQPHRWRGEGRFVARLPQMHKIGEQPVSTLRANEPFAPPVVTTRDWKEEEAGRINDVRWNQYQMSPRRPANAKEETVHSARVRGSARRTAHGQTLPELSPRSKGYWRAVEALALTGSLRPESPGRDPNFTMPSARTALMQTVRRGDDNNAREESHSDDNGKEEEYKEASSTGFGSAVDPTATTGMAGSDRLRAKNLWQTRVALSL